MSPRRAFPPAPTWVSISSSASPAAPSPRWRPKPRNTTGIAIPKCRSIIRSRPRCRIVDNGGPEQGPKGPKGPEGQQGLRLVAGVPPPGRFLGGFLGGGEGGKINGVWGAG